MVLEVGAHHSVPDWALHVAAGLVASLALTTCGPASPAAPQVLDRGRDASDHVAGPRGTLKLAWVREPDTLSPKFFGGSGNGDYQWLFSSTLTYRDLSGAAHPMLAEEIPTRENGGWVVNADGTMITTYRLRRNAKWHDGAPITAQDYVFAYEVYTDRDVPVAKPEPEPLMERVEARDDYTVVIRWKEPYVNANVLGHQQLNPLPRQVHEAKYRTNKASFMAGDEWTTAYVGTGPFRLERWTPGAGMIGRAHLEFALGSPKLDTVDIRFIPDPNAQLANLFSGEVDMINSPGVRASEASIARDRWATTGEGYLIAWATRTAYLEWQFREVPNWQRAITDIRVRQALLHAIDRPGLAEAINLGFSPAADAFIAPADPLFSEVDRVITKYPYDVNRAAVLLAEAGWTRPPGGGPATNASGRSLDVDLTTTVSQQQEGTIITDNWKAAGINPSLSVIPQARIRDGQLRSSFPAAGTNGRTIGPDNFVWTSGELPVAESGWIGSNRGSFFEPEVDRLQKIRVTSLDEPQRRQATVALLKALTDVAGPTPFIYAVEVILARNHVRGPVGNYGPQEGLTWNVHEWEVL